MKPFLGILLITLFAACTKTKKIDFSQYEGPMMEAEDVAFQYSDSAVLKVKGNAKLRLEYENGNQDFPNGLYLEFYNDLGVKTSFLRANNAVYLDKEKKWRAREDVVVFNFEENAQLNTEELFWYPKDEMIKTEKFVTIKTEGDVLYGRGLEAMQDMSSYEIKNTEAEFDIKENEDL